MTRDQDTARSYHLGYGSAKVDRTPSDYSPEVLERMARDLFPYLRSEDFQRGLADARADMAEVES